MYTRWSPTRLRAAHFVDMISTNAAKIMGLTAQGYARRRLGRRIVLLETGIAKTIRAADLHETDYTPWEGTK